MLDVHGLQLFTAVAEKMSFTRAAEAMLLTQSAISHQIARMERELGVSLLNRDGRSISLTPAGQVLLEQAKPILRALTDLVATVKTAASPDQGRLRIGASATACQYLVPDTLREFRECFPKTSLSITPGDTHAVLDSIVHGTIDLGILIVVDARTKIQQYPLFEDELGLVVNPLHPIARLPKVRPQDLTDQRLVLYSRVSTTWRLVERHWSRLRQPMNDPIELGSIEAIKELVKLGLGISVLAKWVIGPQLADGSLVWRPLPGPRLKRRWVVGTQPNRVLSLAEKTFVELLRQCSPLSGEEN
ncbi:MAG: LysR family transcriptional regulator [Burkholderiales bacterium]|nr:LysR family transcriptional regulator [Phycisphaerae bacterium]